MYTEPEFTASDYYRGLDECLDKVVEKERDNLKESFFKGKIEKRIELESLARKSLQGISSISRGDSYRPSAALKDSLQSLVNKVSKEEYHELMFAINSDIRRVNYHEKAHQINELMERVEKISTKITLSNGKTLSTRLVLVKDQSNSRSETTSFIVAAKKLAKEKKESLDMNYGVIELQQNDYVDHSTSNILIEMSNSDFLETTSANRRFKENISEITKQLEIRESAEKAIKACERFREILQTESKEKGIDFSKMEQTLNSIITTKQQELAAANRFLRSYDIDKYIQMSNDFRKSRDAEDTRNSVITQYKNIVKELEDLKKNDPNNFERIHELEERLERIKRSNLDVDIKFGEYDEKAEEAKEEYKHEQQMEEMLAKEAAKESAILKEVNRQYRESLRKEAIRELEANGTFDGIYQEVSGDIRDVNPNNKNREQLIQEKMSEISRQHKASEDELTARRIQEAENRLREIAQDELANSDIITDDLSVIDAKVADMIAQSYMTPAERCRYEMLRDGMDEKDIPDILPTSQTDYYKDGMTGYQHTREIKDIVRDIGNYQQSLSSVYEQDNDYSK